MAWYFTFCNVFHASLITDSWQLIGLICLVQITCVAVNVFRIATHKSSLLKKLELAIKFAQCVMAIQVQKCTNYTYLVQLHCFENMFILTLYCVSGTKTSKWQSVTIVLLVVCSSQNVETICLPIVSEASQTCYNGDIYCWNISL